MKKRILKIFTELARHHISAMLIITVVDMILAMGGSNNTICFSLLLPQRLMIGGENAYMSTGVESFRFYYWALIAVCFALFLLCLICSYRRPGWLICAATMIFLDISVAVWFIIAEKDPSYYLDIIVHVWMIAALIAAYIMQKLAARPPKIKAVKNVNITGLVFAMEDEAMQVLGAYELDKKDINGYTVYSREGAEIMAIISGMGKVSAGAATSLLISLGCTRIVNIGTCGCTGGKFAPGELVLPSVFYDGDFDLSMMNIDTKDPAKVNADEVEAPVPCHTFSTFVTDHRADDGIVEMEAYSVVATCRAHNIPVSVIKIVSDGGDVDEFEGNVESVITRHLDEIKQIIGA